MSGNKNTVFIISGSGGNDAINGMMCSIEQILLKAGFETEYFDSSTATEQSFKKILDLFNTGQVTFAITYLGIGQDLTVNVPIITASAGPGKGRASQTQNSVIKRNFWDHFNVPLLKLHGDMPAYHSARHQTIAQCSANLYPADEFLLQRDWLLSSDPSPSFRCDPWVISDTQFNSIDFNTKKAGKLVYMKNGGNSADLLKLWQEKLPATLGKYLCELAETITPLILKHSEPCIHQTVIDHLDIGKFSTNNLKQVIRLFTAQLDDYTRRTKSTLIAKALLDFPVIFQGGHWDHIDFSNTRAKLVPAQGYFESLNVFQSQLGVIEMSPNISSSCHERMMRAAGSYSFVLSNRTTWLNSIYPQLNEKSFTFSSEHIAQTVSWAIEHPKDCIELGIEFGRRFREQCSDESFVNRLTLIADMLRIEKTDLKPQLQNFFAW